MKNGSSFEGVFAFYLLVKSFEKLVQKRSEICTTHVCFSERSVVNVHNVGDLLPGREQLPEDEASTVRTKYLVEHRHVDSLTL